MQAVFFADGGIIAFGMNLFNMAIIGGLSFYIIKLMNNKSISQKRFSASVFIASWTSVMLGALIAAFEVAPAFEGGIAVTLPAMMFFHAIIGVGEGAITTVLATTIQRFNPAIMSGLKLLQGKVRI
jgi:cobalt/nickel transport system permease protein